MRRALATVLLLTALTGCAPAWAEHRGDALPIEGGRAVRLEHIRSYFDHGRQPPLGEVFGDVRIVGEVVVVDMKVWLGNFRVGRASIRMVDGGRRVEVVCEAPSGGYWAYIERDAEHLQREITRYLATGQHLR